MPKILGISAFYHDSAASLLIDGEIVAAAQEERFSRIKHDERFPSEAIRFCLRSAGIFGSELDAIVFYEKPFLKFERILETYLSIAPRGFTSFRKFMPNWLGNKLFQKSEIVSKLEEIDPSVDWRKKLLFSEHHLSHAASAFFPSPFEEALVVTIDGVGEFATTTVAIGHKNKLEIKKEIQFPHSIGLLYSAFTYFLGFKVNSGEYKVMGLAPYGKPIYAELILKEIIDQKPDGSFRLNMSYFDYCVGETMTNLRFSQLFKMVRRAPEEPLTQQHMDMAASIQFVLEEVLLKLIRSIWTEFPMKNLCMAGGVALNCVANGKLLRAGIFERIWVQPAAGDAGGSLGAAYVGHHLFFGVERSEGNNLDRMKGTYLGPSYSDQDVAKELTALGAVLHTKTESQIQDLTVAALTEGKVVGWHQGAMEFGPRSLGARSILGDPRNPMMQKNLNLKTKFRESFRPFAPAVLREKCEEWFDLGVDSPYMLFVAEVARKHRVAPTKDTNKLTGIELLKQVRSTIPSVTHVDFSARIQTVDGVTNSKFHTLLKVFFEKTGVPILINTSFNIRGEPIVCSPTDSYRCFMGTDIDVLVIENNILYKGEQPLDKLKDYRRDFELD